MSRRQARSISGCIGHVWIAPGNCLLPRKFVQRDDLISVGVRLSDELFEMGAKPGLARGRAEVIGSSLVSALIGGRGRVHFHPTDWIAELFPREYLRIVRRFECADYFESGTK